MKKQYSILFGLVFLLGSSLVAADALVVAPVVAKEKKKEVEKPWDYFSFNIPTIGFEKSFYINDKITGLIGTGFLCTSPYAAIGKIIRKDMRINLGLTFNLIKFDEIRRSISPFVSCDWSLSKYWIMSFGFQMFNYEKSETRNAINANGYYATTTRTKKGPGVFPFIGFKYRF
jgi:hypothetical protein